MAKEQEVGRIIRRAREQEVAQMTAGSSNYEEKD